MEHLYAGDGTEIGENGINVSGGQKHRISLARACYRDAEIYLLDSVLSAVDAHVGKTIFEECITGLLANKTRFLVTHSLQYLSRSDVIIVMRDGRVSEIGSYKELMDSGLKFSELMQAHGGSANESTKSSSEEHGNIQKEKLRDNKKSKAQGKLVEEEQRVTGTVKLKIYLTYALGYSILMLLVILGSGIFAQG